MFVSFISPELISAICISSGVFGVFTMVMGFLVTPSNFPRGLGWLYYIPFMTYSFRSMMYLEYHELKFVNVSESVEESEIAGNFTFNSTQLDTQQGTVEDMLSDKGFQTDGNAILRTFEMENVIVQDDMITLLGWALVMHAITMIYLFWTNYKGRRIFIYDDDE